MNQYQGTYKVVNKDWRQALPETFETFEEAFKAREAWDKNAVIEQLDGQNAEIVYERWYDNYVTDSMFHRVNRA